MFTKVFDIHSHILPGVDDGSKNLEETFEMLKMMTSSGVNTLVATPHYYSDLSVNDFLEIRNSAYNQIANSKKYSNDMPGIVLASEVYLEYDIHKNPDIGKLRIGDTDYILIELPFSKVNEWVYEELFKISSKFGLNIILAHIERYFEFVKTEELKRFREMEIYFQVNIDNLKSSLGKSIQYKYIKNGIADFIGSDCHNTTTRKPCMGEAVNYLSRKLGDDKVNELMNNARLMLDNKTF